MSEVFALAVRLAVGVLTIGLTHPRVGLVVAGGWWWAVRAAKGMGLKAATGGSFLLPFAALVYLWKNRRDVRDMMFWAGVCAAGTIWLWALRFSPAETRLRVGVFSVLMALAVGGVWAFRYLHGQAPTWSNFKARRAQTLRQWDVERTVAAVTDDAVKVSDVRADGDAVVASVMAAPGQSPADLQDHLLTLLAATTVRLTGREAVSVSVSKTRSPGRFLVRVSTDHPLRKVVRWRDL